MCGKNRKKLYLQKNLDFNLLSLRISLLRRLAMLMVCFDFTYLEQGEMNKCNELNQSRAF